MNTNAKIYVLQGDDGLVKVGHSVSVERRARQIGGVTIAHQTQIKEQAEIIERTAHRLLRLAGKGVRSEWFSATVAEAIDAIRRAERIANGLELDLARIRPVRNPPKPLITIEITEEQLAAIDAIISEREGVPDRTTIIREMLTKGLKAYGAL